MSSTPSAPVVLSVPEQSTSSTQLQGLFDAQRLASRAQIDVPIEVRRDRLLRLRALIEDHAAALAQAVERDFGVRSLQLTDLADFFVLRSLMSDTLKSLAKWMNPVKVSTPLYLQPARAMLLRQPLGVVGVIAPWNYPVQLALGPVITALAAGNRVMLKPSELTPHTSALMASLVDKSFAADELCVVLGDGALSAEFSALPFDHLFFTGSTAVGRKVAEAAAVNLTPTTLELGGKSPCIVDSSCDLNAAAVKIAHGKLFNAGQTCIAPDYVLLPQGREAAFSEAYERATQRLFPTIAGNPDYAAIISDRHHDRLKAMLTQAQADGARVQVMGVAASATAAPTGRRQMAPSLVYGAASGSKLMDEEIFGPILPVVTYSSLDEAIDYINSKPRPLALYWFGEDAAAQRRVLARTVSGGVTINDTLLHIAHEHLPFGGVGDSGWGAYHGEAGFLRLSQQKPVLVQSKWARGDLFYPPYGKRFDYVMGLLKRWL